MTYKVTVSWRDRTQPEFKMGHAVSRHMPAVTTVSRVSYEGGFVVIRDEQDDQVAFPADLVEKVLVQRTR